MSRTLTEPPTSSRMWKRLLRATHPDITGDDGGLFVWARALQEYVCSDALEGPPPFSYAAQTRPSEPPSHPPRTDGRGRIPFEPGVPFSELTARALRVGEDLDDPYRTLLGLLGDCVEAPPSDPVLWRQQRQGATYKSIAALAYRANLSNSERIQLYRIAESIPLAQRHVGHVLSRL